MALLALDEAFIGLLVAWLLMNLDHFGRDDGTPLILHLAGGPMLVILAGLGAGQT